jgi:hypothetical protein
MVLFARGIVLAKASYELFWAEKSHAANGKAQACTQDALVFFLLTLERRLGGVGGCSHYVPFKFQWVPIMFSKCSSSSQCVPQHVQRTFAIVHLVLPMPQKSCQSVNNLARYAFRKFFWGMGARFQCIGKRMNCTLCGL